MPLYLAGEVRYRLFDAAVACIQRNLAAQSGVGDRLFVAAQHGRDVVRRQGTMLARIGLHALRDDLGGRLHMHQHDVRREPQDAVLDLPRDRLAVVVLVVCAVAEVHRAVHRVVDVQADSHPVRPKPRVRLNVIVQAVPLRHLPEDGTKREHLLPLFFGHIRLRMPRCVRQLPMVVNQRKARADVRLHPIVDGKRQRASPRVLASCQYQSHFVLR